jgi:hypothetical protein
MERHFASEIVFCLLYWIDRIGLETSAGNAKKEEKQVNMMYKTADPDPVAPLFSLSKVKWKTIGNVAHTVQQLLRKPLGITR